MHRDSLFNNSKSTMNISESILSLFCFFRIWHMVCSLETRQASLHRICTVRHVRIAWQCVLPPAVFYFRYALIYTVWNAVLLDALNLCTDRLSRELCVCLSWSSIAAAVKCTCIFEYFYMKLMYTQSVMFSEQDKTSDISKQICALVWMQPVKAATVYDLISNNQTPIMLRKKRKTHNYLYKKLK